ncbi:hypothetical protein RRG08_047279 [Elysia crispata]|uniref:Uncharacterized protein n=1 Tax=Elysia crispata TaxID=231223 RepID=A0AAE1DDP8_9GAST|nr:hypothetical protein RRG08_047279 [Elysia crispata]
MAQTRSTGVQAPGLPRCLLFKTALRKLGSGPVRYDGKFQNQELVGLSSLWGVWVERGEFFAFDQSCPDVYLEHLVLTYGSLSNRLFE